jgi:hypothetical protein
MERDKIGSLSQIEKMIYGEKRPNDVAKLPVAGLMDLPLHDFYPMDAESDSDLIRNREKRKLIERAKLDHESVEIISMFYLEREEDRIPALKCMYNDEIFLIDGRCLLGQVLSLNYINSEIRSKNNPLNYQYNLSIHEYERK